MPTGRQFCSAVKALKTSSTATDQIRRMTSEYQFAEARVLCAAAGAIPAVFEDLRHRRISNSICLFTFCAGIALASFENGASGFGLSILGAIAGFAVFLFFYWIRAMGGGDVKLMAGYGAMLGLNGVLPAAMMAAVAGALTAFAGVLYGYFRGTRPETIPYAPAIAFGVLAVLLSQMPGAH